MVTIYIYTYICICIPYYIYKVERRTTADFFYPPFAQNNTLRVSVTLKMWSFFTSTKLRNLSN